MESSSKQRQHWRKTLAVTGLSLAAWFLASFFVPYFARDLAFEFLGWPFSFWVTSQGALLVYVGLTWWYARRMDRLDEQFSASAGSEE